MNIKKKKALLQRRRWRIRKKVRGTAERPRLSVKFTNCHIHAQAIDDSHGHTVASISTVAPELKAKKLRSNVSSATEVGALMAAKVIAAGVRSVVFDRNGRIYHGKVKAFAEAARSAGLEF
jgi:large subunit ribosomal protein L18